MGRRKKPPVMKKAVPTERARALIEDARKGTTAAQERGEALLAEIARRRTRIIEDFYDIGVALAEIEKKKLYVALGAPSFEELLRKQRVLGATQARRLLHVVASMRARKRTIRSKLRDPKAPDLRSGRAGGAFGRAHAR
jgi:hypothetical protein